MIEEIDFIKRYDELLNIQPNYGLERVKKPVRFDYIGLEAPGPRLLFSHILRSIFFVLLCPFLC